MQLGLSESARVTTVDEARYRINKPNSRPRSSRIIALDATGERVLKSLAGMAWNDAKFLKYVRARPATDQLASLPVDAVLKDLDGNETSLNAEVAGADVTMMLIGSGSPAGAAEVVGNCCFVHGKLATGIVLNAGEGGADLAATLKAIRPYAAMLVVSTAEDYVAEILTSLRV
ncbi:hypothetical protein HDIA_4249 [Hartmannibacter diazotrophicus]|uniref:3-methyl-2-oxobutanoate hydroxymethyltransferase n=1 Tax=Hartmannibacter diazotrophicus TaxID=1482074 RepID=A0A2C9DC90_9HYPH|nr:hypothetical protein [Hartmannibacter diazotrophicus]SON57790.1 hypothetical protein HDIA_4249 [Hartmannibacter diazotrophicus]